MLGDQLKNLLASAINIKKKKKLQGGQGGYKKNKIKKKLKIRFLIFITFQLNAFWSKNLNIIFHLRYNNNLIYSA